MSLFSVSNPLYNQPQVGYYVSDSFSKQEGNELIKHLANLELTIDFTRFEEIRELELNNVSVKPRFFDIMGEESECELPRFSLLEEYFRRVKINNQSDIVSQLSAMIQSCAEYYELQTAFTANEPISILLLLTEKDLLADNFQQAFTKNNSFETRTYINTYKFLYIADYNEANAAKYLKAIEEIDRLFVPSNFKNFIYEAEPLNELEHFVATHISASVYFGFVGRKSLNFGFDEFENNFDMSSNYEYCNCLLSKTAPVNPNLLQNLTAAIDSSLFSNTGIQSLFEQIREICQKPSEYDSIINEVLNINEKSQNKLFLKLKAMGKEEFEFDQLLDQQPSIQLKFDKNMVEIFDNFTVKDFYQANQTRSIPNILLTLESVKDFHGSSENLKEIVSNQLYLNMQRFCFLVEVQQYHLAFVLICEIKREFDKEENAFYIEMLNDQYIVLQQIMLFSHLTKGKQGEIFYDSFFSEKSYLKMKNKNSRELLFDNDYFCVLIEKCIMKSVQSMDLAIQQFDIFERDECKAVYYEQFMNNIFILIQLLLELSEIVRSQKYQQQILVFLLNDQKIWQICHKLIQSRCYITPYTPLDALLVLLQLLVKSGKTQLDQLLIIQQALSLSQLESLPNVSTCLHNLRAEFVIKQYYGNCVSNNALCEKSVEKLHYLSAHLYCVNAVSKKVLKVYNCAESTLDSQQDTKIVSAMQEQIGEIDAQTQSRLYAIECMPQKSIITQNKLMQNKQQIFNNFVVDNSRDMSFILLDDYSSEDRQLFNYRLQFAIYNAVNNHLLINHLIEEDQYSIEQFRILYIANEFQKLINDENQARMLSYYYDLLKTEEIKLNAEYQSEILKLRKIFNNLNIEGQQELLRTIVYKDDCFFIYVSLYNHNKCDITVTSIQPIITDSVNVQIIDFEPLSIPTHQSGVFFLKCRLQECDVEEFNLLGYKFNYQPSDNTEQLHLDAYLHKINTILCSQSYRLNCTLQAAIPRESYYENELILIRAFFSISTNKPVNVIFKTSDQQNMVIINEALPKISCCDINRNDYDSFDDILFQFTLSHEQCIEFMTRTTSSCSFKLFTICDDICQASELQYKIIPSKCSLQLRNIKFLDSFYQAALHIDAELFQKVKAGHTIQEFWGRRKLYCKKSDLNNIVSVGIPNGSVSEIDDILLFHEFSQQEPWVVKNVNLLEDEFVVYQHLLRKRRKQCQFIYGLHEIEESRFVLKYYDIE